MVRELARLTRLRNTPVIGLTLSTWTTQGGGVLTARIPSTKHAGKAKVVACGFRSAVVVKPETP
ncbi:hypothetical protein SAMN05421543_11882 [Alicyclobacillus macrosporangiidus]|uniref:Uncharacterized protein n=1 Tax=Alicyclobacillus macrosporangiidus TaxID=392015 RepID=A0A1I7KSB1_9BACL|nr:hypothetical protein SAMN05421543_11882 [Alicyclobacillus macrosporangiidus]